MTKKDFIEKWNVAYESKEQKIEFGMEMLTDLMLVIEEEHEQCGVLRQPDVIKSVCQCEKSELLVEYSGGMPRCKWCGKEMRQTVL